MLRPIRHFYDDRGIIMAIGIEQATQKRMQPKHSADGKAGIVGRLSLLFSRGVHPKELLFFSSQLSLMLEIDTPVNRALVAITSQTRNPFFKEILEKLRQEVEDGRQLSDAMKNHPRVFSKVFSSMVKAGETVGLLKQILDRLVEMEERRQALKTQIKSALTYPAVLCVLAFLVVIFVLVGVLPKFMTFFAGKETILPLTTRFLMEMSRSLKGYWYLYAAALIAVSIGSRMFLRSKPGAALIDWLAVNAPVIGSLSKKLFNCQLLRTLGNLMESHVPLIEALEVTRGTIGNRYFRDFIDRITVHVREGGRFSRPFADYPYTLDSVKQMVATGEEAGNLPRVMLRLAEFYDAELDRELRGFAALIEPAALIVMGAVVGLIVSSVILPMFRLAHVVQ
jgi:type II secretory pathway component PulF